MGSQLENLLKTTDKDFVRLGGWAAAAGVASGVGKDPYFAGNSLQGFLGDLGKNLSPAARDALKKLDKKKRDNDPARLRQLLDELANGI